MSTKKPVPRKHHWLPQFYLAGFTPSGKKDDCVWVLDQTTYKHERRKVKKVAHQRDYYSAIREGELDATLETNLLATIEGKAKPLLEAIRKSGELPEGEDFETFTYFLALMISRVPSKRNEIRAIQKTTIKDYLSQELSRKEIVDSDIKRLREDLLAHYSVDEMQNFLASGEYNLDLGENVEKNNELKLMDQLALDLIPFLIDREWYVMRVTPGQGEFICSDRPVRSYFTKHMKDYLPAGLIDPDSAIIFPIDKHVCMVSYFEGGSGHLCVDRDFVAQTNSLIGTESGRWLYSANREISWMKKGGVVGNTKELVEMLRQVNIASKL